jgi:hypothetical protein
VCEGCVTKRKGNKKEEEKEKEEKKKFKRKEAHHSPSFRRPVDTLSSSPVRHPEKRPHIAQQMLASESVVVCKHTSDSLLLFTRTDTLNVEPCA